jgi:manganese/zinc/iron transport system permease protein
MFSFINPYTGKEFFSFFSVFFHRMFSGFSPLVDDEIQLFVLLLSSLSCALLGVFITLKQVSMQINSLSHTLLLGLAMAAFFGFIPQMQEIHSLGFLFVSSVFTALMTLSLTEFLSRYLHLQKDASIGLVFTFLFSLGVLLLSMFFKNSYFSIDIVMGNVDLLTVKDLFSSFFILLMNSVVIVLFLKQFQAVVFDEPFAKSLGIATGFFQFLLILLTAITISTAFSSVGIILVIALFTIPPLNAKVFCKTIKSMLFFSCLISSLSSFLAVALSRHIFSKYLFALSTGALLVSILSILYLFSLIIVAIKRKKKVVLEK